MDRNWPELIPKLNRVIAGSKFSEQEIHKLRKAGVSYSPSLQDGSVVFSPGEGFKNVIQAHQFEIRIKNAEHPIKNNSSIILKHIRRKIRRKPKKICLSTVQLTDDIIYMKDTYSGICFSFELI